MNDDGFPLGEFMAADNGACVWLRTEGYTRNQARARYAYEHGEFYPDVRCRRVRMRRLTGERALEESQGEFDEYFVEDASGDIEAWRLTLAEVGVRP